MSDRGDLGARANWRGARGTAADAQRGSDTTGRAPIARTRATDGPAAGGSAGRLRTRGSRGEARDRAVDDMGQAVLVPRSVSRVVSLVPSLTEAVASCAPRLLVGATIW